MARLSERLVARLPSLASRDFRNLLGGQFVSLLGSQMQQVALVWQLYLFDQSPLALGLLGAFRVVPVLLLALVGGVAADTWDRRRLMMASQSLMAVGSLVLALATLGGWASAGLLYGMTALSGVALAFDTPARQALVPQLVPREHLSGALSQYALGREVATIAGPALGGVVLAHGGVTPIYFFDVASFLAVLGALLTLRHRDPPRPRGRIDLGSVREGFAFLRRTPVIGSTMVLDFFATFFGGSMLLMPIFATELLHVGPQGLGLLYAAQPAGAVLTGFVLSAVPLPRRQGQAILWSVAAYGAAIAVFGASRWLWLSLVALFVSGAADTVSMVIRQTLRQLLTPDGLRGRMTSVNMLFFMGGPQLGEVEAGVVARFTSPRFSVTSGGLACIGVALVTALLAPALRHYQAPPEEPPS